MKVVEIHTLAEVEQEVEHLRHRLQQLMVRGIVRPHFVEHDLKIEAYNQLTLKKCRS